MSTGIGVFKAFTAESKETANLSPILCGMIDKCDFKVFSARTITEKRKNFNNSVSSFLYKLFVQNYLFENSDKLKNYEYRSKIKNDFEQV